MRLAFFLALLIGLSGCTTPYQRVGVRGGFSETELGQDRYLVNFSGNGFTRANLVRDYAIKRARELCSEMDKEAVIEEMDGSTETAQLGAATASCNSFGPYGNRTTNCSSKPGMMARLSSYDVVVKCVPPTSPAPASVPPPALAP